jgi:hypothetical protein
MEPTDESNALNHIPLLKPTKRWQKLRFVSYTVGSLTAFNAMGSPIQLITTISKKAKRR